MKVVEKCELCDTTLTYDLEDGKGTTMVFTAHDAAFCKTLTLAKIQMILDLLQSEKVEHARTREELQHRSRIVEACRDFVNLMDEYGMTRG